MCLLNGTRYGLHLVWVVSHFCIETLINRVNYLKLTEKTENNTIPSLIKNEIYPFKILKLSAGNLFVCYDWPSTRNCLKRNVLRFIFFQKINRKYPIKTPVRHFHQKHITFQLIVIQRMKNKTKKIYSKTV